MDLKRRKFLKQSAITTSFVTLGSACSRTTSSSTQADGDLMDAVSTASAIRNKDITALEAVEAAIDRAEQINPAINAIVTKTFDRAREQARNTPKGALSGVPTFVKDLFHISGVPTEFGSRAYRGAIANMQYPFIDDFQENGLISLGKTSTPEFGLTATTEPLSSGPTRNPWNTDHSTGGSSGGAAALVAAGVVPIAHATDGGGSIRIPAACCGLVGLKPSRDRFRPARDESRTPVRISAHGVVSRTVRDTAAFMAAMEIPSGEGPLTPVGLISQASSKRLTIGVINSPPLGTKIHSDVTRAIEDISNLCETLGHKTVEINNQVGQKFGDDFLLYWAGAANFYVSTWEASTGKKATENEFESFTLGLREHYLANAKKMQASVLALIKFNTTWRSMFEGVDLILSPVLTSPGLPITLSTQLRQMLQALRHSPYLLQCQQITSP